MENQPKEKHAGGRPRVTKSDKRSAKVSVFFRPGERELVERAADAVGLSLAAYTRHATLIRAGEDARRTLP